LEIQKPISRVREILWTFREKTSFIVLQAWELIVTAGVFTLLVWIAMSCQCLLISCLVLYSDMLSALQAATMQRTKEVVIDKLWTMEGEFIVADPFIGVAHINRNSWDTNCCQLGLLCPTALKVQKDCADLEQVEGGYCHELSSERKGQTCHLTKLCYWYMQIGTVTTLNPFELYTGLQLWVVRHPLWLFAFQRY
jgi:hypothetical protein